jgi:hypothetical protein
MSMVRDANGNPGTGLATLAGYAVDTAAPTASVGLSISLLSTIHTIDATIVFDEAVTGLTAASFSAPHATVSNVSAIDGGRVWHATLTGTADTVELTAASVLTLDMSTVRDAAGNAGAGTVTSQDYYVDTRAPAAVSVELGGSSLSPGGTMEVTITVSEPIEELNAAAIVAPHASVGNVVHVGGNIWRATLTGTDSTPSSGNQVSVDMSLVRDLLGNSGSGIVRSASSYAIDTGAPTVASIALDGSLINTNQAIGLTIRFSEAVPGLTAAAIIAPHAVVSGLHTTDNITWYAYLAGIADTTATGAIVGVDLSKVHDAAGNVGSGITHATQGYEVDTSRPTVVGAIELDGSVLGIEDYVVATIRFSEKVYVNADAISAPHARVYAVYPADASLSVWQVLLIAADNGTNAPSNELTIDLSKVSDLSGNAGSGTFGSGNYAVDTIPRIEFNDSGWIDNDAVTNDASAYLSGSFVDRGSEPLKVKVKVDGTVVPDGDVTVYHSSELGYAGWNTSVNLADGPHHVEVWFEDAGGRQIALGSQDITVDTTGPSITAPLETGPALNVAAPLEIRFNEAVYWDYDADGDHFGTVNVYNEDTHAYTQVYVDDRNLSADRKTLTIAADDLHLVGGSHYRATLPYSMADVAGNWLGENEIAFQTSGTYTDDTAPTALRAEAGTNSGWWGDSYPAGTVIDITILFSEPVRVVDGQSPVLRLNTGGVATYYNTSGDGREVNFKYTVAAGDADTARLAIVDSSGLVDAIADLAGHKLDAAHIDYSALEPSMTGYGSDIISVDTHAPGAITDLALDPYSDRGDLDNDLITNDPRPTLYGTGAEPNAMELRIYEGSELVGYGYAHSDGSWWADVNSDDALADGIHHLSVTQVDQAGNESPHSAALAITIDTIGPASAPGAPVLAAASDTGTLNDGITADNTPTFNGTGAEPNRVVKLFANEHFVGQAVSNASGAWSITVTDPLADRTYSFGAQQFDLAGNKSAYSDSVTVTIAAGAPATSSVSSLATASDSRVLADSHIGSASTGIDLAAMFMTGELPQAHAYWEIGDSFAGRAALIGLPDLALSIAPLG